MLAHPRRAAQPPNPSRASLSQMRPDSIRPESTPKTEYSQPTVRNSSHFCELAIDSQLQNRPRVTRGGIHPERQIVPRVVAARISQFGVGARGARGSRTCLRAAVEAARGQKLTGPGPAESTPSSNLIPMASSPGNLVQSDPARGQSPTPEPIYKQRSGAVRSVHKPVPVFQAEALHHQLIRLAGRHVGTSQH